MPIKRTQGDELPEVSVMGKLRKGKPKAYKADGTQKKPEDLTYFRYAPEPQFEGLGHEEIAARVLGKEPKSVRFFFPFSDIEDVYSEWMKHYSSGSLQTRCDGVRISKRYNPLSCRVEDADNDCITVVREQLAKQGVIEQDLPKPCECKPRIAMYMVIPELMQALGVFGLVQFVSSSWHDVGNLSKTLNGVYAITGSLSGIPFILSRSPKEISVVYTDKSGVTKPRKATKSIVYLKPEDEWVRNNFNFATLMPGTQVEQLPSGADPETGVVEDPIEFAATHLERQVSGKVSWYIVSNENESAIIHSDDVRDYFNETTAQHAAKDRYELVGENFVIAKLNEKGNYVVVTINGK